MGWYDRGTRRTRDLSCGDARIHLEFEVRRVQCKSCSKVKREQLAFLARLARTSARANWCKKGFFYSLNI